jgi:hypothetical protein
MLDSFSPSHRPTSAKDRLPFKKSKIFTLELQSSTFIAPSHPPSTDQTQDAKKSAFARNYTLRPSTFTFTLLFGHFTKLRQRNTRQSKHRFKHITRGWLSAAPSPLSCGTHTTFCLLHSCMLFPSK